MIATIRCMGTRRTLALLLATTLLTGCGFHLRGQGGPSLTALGSVQIIGLPEFHPLRRALGDALDAAGAETTEDASAPTTLRIGNYRQDSRALGFDSRNKATEYLLEERFVFALHRATGDDIIADQELEAVRLISDPESEVLGRGREEEVLREDMHRQLARQVVERIAAQIK